MTMQQVQQAPAGFSLPEWIVHQTLVRLGKVPNVDFVFQSSFQGGRLERGGLVIDFLFIDPGDLAINVQGGFFHNETPQVIARDRMTRAQLAGQGITLIFIDEEDILADPVRHVRDALSYRDNSSLGGIGG